MNDLPTELLRLVNAYHWRWVTFHGDHGDDCKLCAGLHSLQARALAAMVEELGPEPELGPMLFEVVA